MVEGILIFIVMVVLLVVMTAGMAALLFVLYRKARPGQALILNKLQARPVVTFSGGLVLPVIHQAEVIDITAKQITFTDHIVTTSDNRQASVSATFTMKINSTEDDVIRAADALGVEKASSPEGVAAHFRETLAQALTTAAAALPWDDLERHQERFREQVVEAVGTNLQGFILEEVAISMVSPVDADLAAELIAAARRAADADAGRRLQEQLHRGAITRADASRQLLHLLQEKLDEPRKLTEGCST